jgi:hypothetical protein
MGQGRFAELHFENDVAEIYDHAQAGTYGPLATVPIKSTIQDEYGETALDPECEQSKNLMMFLHADRMLRTLEYLQKKLAARTTEERMDEPTWPEDDAMLREVEEAIELATTVPQ